MPSATHPDPPVIPKWKRPQKTSEVLDWADIKVINLETFGSPGEKTRLAEELRDAVSGGVPLLHIMCGLTIVGTHYGILLCYWNRIHTERGRPAI